LRWRPQAELTDQSSLTSDVCRDCLDIGKAIQTCLAAAVLPLPYCKQKQLQS
jgi:hypothetical protein